MKKFLFFLFAAIGICTLSSCGSIGIEWIDTDYYNGYYNNPYGTVIYYNSPVVTRYTYPLPPPPPPRYRYR
ncbi:MAG: hypothetical protein MSS98_02200 [Alphaproteobacteria bacterium]|nr:hypothetical protein [Alphaproteobacteria bacterium]MDY4690078.1 hypothetical protein [Alphaproteobacteria bacterium]